MDPNGKFQLIFKVGLTPFPHPEAPGRAPQLGNSNGPIIAYSKKRATGYETEMVFFLIFRTLNLPAVRGIDSFLNPRPSVCADANFLHTQLVQEKAPFEKSNLTLENPPCCLDYSEKTDGKITYRWGIDSIDATGRFSHLQQSLLLAPGPAKRSCLNMLGKAQKNSSDT
jgi:hypothetical protein